MGGAAGPAARACRGGARAGGTRHLRQALAQVRQLVAHLAHLLKRLRGRRLGGRQPPHGGRPLRSHLGPERPVRPRAWPSVGAAAAPWPVPACAAIALTVRRVYCRWGDPGTQLGSHATCGARLGLRGTKRLAP